MREALERYLRAFMVWGFAALVFRDNLGNVAFIASLFLALGGIAGFYGEPRGYLVKALAFLPSSLLFLLWPENRWGDAALGTLLLFVGSAYLVSYPLYAGGNNFLPRNMLGVALVGGIVGLLAFYPFSSRDFTYVADALVLLALLWVSSSVGKYASMRFHSGEITAIEYPLKNIGERDFFLRDAERAVSMFVDKGVKSPLAVFVARNAPEEISDGMVETALRSIIEYQPEDEGGFLTPPWLMELYREREKERRSKLVRELLETVSRW
ncbi:hypothetical protein [Thermococcus sp. Bubb.Bath]|uniref:hypothetical protein n=1 Tax=Thermococcus sp. Bubb.Bath TaxID=1638242 RepID=UPI00143C8A67|nr:hypothetical protein [Thermococcus sp. Bubb.Bath]NJF24909.1 hypothetical protein [Thermococcus sp. Bubb.Bath]